MSLTDHRTAEERLLHALTSALERYGLGPNVGLLDPAVFPQHRGGTGILVVCEPADRGAAGRLLEAMGCAVRDHDIGIEAHLRNGTELGPAPEVPPVHVSSADSGSAAESAVPEPVKRCNGPCARLLPLDEFS